MIRNFITVQVVHLTVLRISLFSVYREKKRFFFFVNAKKKILMRIKQEKLNGILTFQDNFPHCSVRKCSNNHKNILN